MKINGLKVFAIKDWKSDTTFTSDNGTVMPILANHKLVCQDENNDIVNVTVVTPTPLSVKVGEVLKDVTLIGNVSKTSFGWTIKVKL